MACGQAKKERAHPQNTPQNRGTAVHILGFCLALMAGWVDTLGVAYFMDESAPFLTGRVVRLGKALIDQNAGLVRDLVLILAAFLVGAVLSTWITRNRGLQGGLALTGLLVLLTPLLAFLKHINGALITIPMAMGAQNAASSLTAIKRTTHLTGPTTDIGIQLALGNWKRVAFWSLRWLAFFLGVVLSYQLILILGAGPGHIGLILIPGLAILALALLQAQVFRIPLACDTPKRQEGATGVSDQG